MIRSFILFTDCELGIRTAALKDVIKSRIGIAGRVDFRQSKRWEDLLKKVLATLIPTMMCVKRRLCEFDPSFDSNFAIEFLRIGFLESKPSRADAIAELPLGSSQ